MNELTRNMVKGIFDFSNNEPILDIKMDMLEKQIRRNTEGIERSALSIAACLYGVKKCFDYYHKIIRDEKTYDNIYEYAEDKFSFKKTSTKNAINVIETYFEEDGTLKSRFLGFGYSQLVELLPFKAEIPENITAESTVKDVRELKKGQTSDQTAELTPLESLSADEISDRELLCNRPEYNQEVDPRLRWNPEEYSDEDSTEELEEEVENGQTSDQNNDIADENISDLVADDEDEIVEGVGDYPVVVYDEIAEDNEEIEKNTTNDLDYLLENGQTSDQKNTLHLFKNKKEREDFIKNYKPWGVWKELPELGLKFYRYEFANGAVLIVTECPEYHNWATTKWVTVHRHCLILKHDYELPNAAPGCCRAYDLSGTAPTYIIDYMTKFAKEI